jgi:signal peptide peptidase SppA
MSLDELLGRVPFLSMGRRPANVAVVRLQGVIGAAGPALGSRINLASVAARLEAAFKMKNLSAVALIINSPGGSPVQSAQIARRVRLLAAEHEVPVYAFAEDVAASGGYMLALAADEIFADAASIVGSIGVVSGGFGFPEALSRLGIERRLYTTGERKAMLDPFSPEKPGDVARLREIQADIHTYFKDLVRERRGDRLKAPEETLFTGDIWTGREALPLGLIDGIGDLKAVMRERYGEDVKLKLVTERKGFLKRRLGLTSARLPDLQDLPASFADELIDAAERRLAWARFGL